LLSVLCPQTQSCQENLFCKPRTLQPPKCLFIGKNLNSFEGLDHLKQKST
jgi:hypothetical protein